MKVRQGFVSNSSTSSFTLLTTKETHDRILAEASGEDLEWLDCITQFIDVDYHGTPSVCLSYIVNDEGPNVEWDNKKYEALCKKYNLELYHWEGGLIDAIHYYRNTVRKEGGFVNVEDV